MDKDNNLLMIVAIVALGLALTNLGITMNKAGDIREITGLASSDTGTANLTLTALASIIFNVSVIDWGSGAVDASPTKAFIDSEGNIVDGTWSAVSQGLTLRNTGNCNVTFTLQTSNVASQFIGGTSPAYDLKVTNNQTGTCATGYNSLSSYTNATGSTQAACTNMSFESTRQDLDIDVNLTIPEDAVAEAKGSVITASASCV